MRTKARKGHVIHPSRPRLIASDGESELWQRGRAAYLGVAILPEYSPRLRRALERRRDASLAGRCPCGASVPGWPAPPGKYAVMEHAPTCDEGDQRLGPLLSAEQPAALAQN